MTLIAASVTYCLLGAPGLAAIRIKSTVGSRPGADYFQEFIKFEDFPLITEEQEKALFSDVIGNFNVVSQLPLPKRNGCVAAAHYHKTGSDFSESMGLAFERVLNMTVKAYHDLSPEEFPTGATWDHFWSKEIDVPSVGYNQIQNPSASWNLPEGVPLVHWIRDPVDLGLSGYRYHSLPETMMYAEKWEQWDRFAPRIDADAHKAIFSYCGYTCTYFELLRAAPEQEGVIIEMLMERHEIQNMVSNLQRWANNPQVLHVSLEHLRTDYNATVKCVLKFYGLDYVEELPGQLQPTAMLRSASHVTSGRYNNTALKSMLRRHKTWGAQFEEVQELSRLIFERQNRTFGCPMPE